MNELQLRKKHRHFSGEVEYYTHPSSTTKTPMNFSLFRPSKAKNTQTKHKALLWLSGLTCTEENFITKASATETAEELGVMIFCPDTSPRGLNLPGEHESYDFGSGAGFYLNATTKDYVDHYRMEDYLIKEFCPMLFEHFDVDPKALSLSGHSMGGHGALTLGLKHQHLFKTVSAFSPIVAPTQCPWGQKAFKGYLGADETLWSAYDTCELLKTHQRPDTLLIDQGEADEFLKEQLKTPLLETAAAQNQQPLKVRYQKGYDHSYFFISTFIKDHLRFHFKGEL